MLALEFPLLGLLNVRAKRQMTHMNNCGFQITDFAYTNCIPVLVLSPFFFLIFFLNKAVRRIIEQFGLEGHLKVI